MKRILAFSCAVLALSAPFAAHADSQSKTKAEPYPIEYWTLRDQISNVEISPDGKYLAFMKIASKDGNPIIEIYDAANLNKEPHRLGGKSMEITTYGWVGNDEMIVAFRDQVSKNIKGFNQGAYKGKTALFSMDNKKFTQLNKEVTRAGNKNTFESLEFISPLEMEEGKILVRYAEYGRGKSYDSPDYFKMDLKSGSKELVTKADGKYRGFRFDAYGNPRFAFTSDDDATVFHYRRPGEGGWTEYYRLPTSSFEEFSYGGMVEGDPNRIYAIANNGHDVAGLWTYNLETKSFEDLVYRDDTVDVWSTSRHSNGWAKPGLVTGVTTYKDKFKTEYFDANEEALINQFRANIPHADLVRITSRSRDGKVMIVKNDGPRDPGTFYLYNNGKFSKIGSAQGLLKPENLADVEYITYPSRDGKMIPAFITVPNSEGPHPLVVMPHGGPFVREVVLYDEWAQMLANNGYMVMQPQYRGSQGYGIDFYTTAFMEKGEGGLKMQDDKDDGVKYLIEQGMVDKDRVAFFGWSYGGYAALIAAARTPNLYKCSIAGAAVADNMQQLNYYRDRLDSDSAQGQEQIKFWTESINPIEEAGDVNIPLLLIHGSIDQRVPVKHAKRYVDKLKSAGVKHDYIELKDADHFSNTLFYKHKMKMYPAMIEFLEDDCGM